MILDETIAHALGKALSEATRKEHREEEDIGVLTAHTWIYN